MRIINVLLGFCWVFCSQGVTAARYVIPENGDTVVGYLQLGEMRRSDTLPDIARRYNLGFNEINIANPGMDAWVPDHKRAVLIPSAFILPPKPWKGIIINLAEMRLYYFPPTKKNQSAVVQTYPLAIGQASWRTPLGIFQITEKIEKPSWTVPASIIAEDASLSRYGNRRIIPGGDEENPLGEYALMLNASGYLIHGTNKPYSIGRRVSRGCLRMYPEDIDALFDEVTRGTTVRIISQSFKVGKRQGVVYVESHHSNYVDNEHESENFTSLVSGVITLAPQQKITTREWRRLNQIAAEYSGIPVPFVNLMTSSGNKQQWQVKLREFSGDGQLQPVEQLLKRLFLPYVKDNCSNNQQSCVTIGPLDNRSFAEATVDLLGAKLIANPAIKSISPGP
ncbi:MAG: L,D-transpeptidase family protein [Gammaproteobacteria bacterium]|nr:L,D-transpeptidase family protein [Gammaproteobacteria bacterium]